MPTMCPIPGAGYTIINTTDRQLGSHCSLWQQTNKQINIIKSGGHPAG